MHPFNSANPRTERGSLPLALNQHYDIILLVNTTTSLHTTHPVEKEQSEEVWCADGVQHADKLGAVHGIPHGEETAWEDAQLEELGYRLVLVHCKGRENNYCLYSIP